MLRVLIQLIFRPTRTKNQLYKIPNIAQLETSHYLWYLHSAHFHNLRYIITMSDLSSKTPWRNGYWASPNMPAWVYVVDGEKMDAKNMIALDYPDIEGNMGCLIVVRLN